MKESVNIINMITGEGYDVFRFPDGEINVKIQPIELKYPVDIICRVRTPDELVMLYQIGDILKYKRAYVRNLSIYYLMGMRNDRVFDDNRAFGLAMVADVVNSVGAERVEILEPHSEATLRLIKNSESMRYQLFDNKEMNYTLCYPDSGARDRYKEPGLVCEKKRDKNGAVAAITITNTPSIFVGGKIAVVDDLCDGGGTFLALAPILREFKPKELVLVVTHMIQESAIQKLTAVYDRVIFTDSYRDWSISTVLVPNAEVINIVKK